MGHSRAFAAVQILKLAQARKILKQACEACPEDKKVWKEAVRMAPPHEAKGIIANAIRHLPNSVSLWKLAASLESEVASKKARRVCVCVCVWGGGGGASPVTTSAASPPVVACRFVSLRPCRP